MSLTIFLTESKMLFKFILAPNVQISSFVLTHQFKNAFIVECGKKRTQKKIQIDLADVFFQKSTSI